MLNSKNLKDFFFLITIGVLFIGFLYVLSPYLGVIILAVILVELFYPWYTFLEKRLKSTTIASFLAGMSVILTVVVPLTIVLAVVVMQATSLLDQASEFWQTHDLISEYKNVLAEINEFIARFSSDPNNQVTSEEVKSYSINLSQDFLSIIINAIESTASGALSMISKFFMLIIGIFTLFPMRDKLYETLKTISPLEDRLDDLFIRNFTQTAKSVIKGTFVVAIGLGTIGGLLFWILGIDGAVFWGMLMAIFSIIPIGSGIIWIPAAIYLAATGEVLKAIILIAAGLIMTNGIDTLLRTRVVKTESKIHPILLAFCILGGLETFGILGFLYGPLIAVFFLSMMEVYKERYK